MISTRNIDIVSRLARGLNDCSVFLPESALSRVLSGLPMDNMDGASTEELMEIMSESGHYELVMEELKDVIAKASLKSLSVIKNRCIPLIDELHADAVELSIARAAPSRKLEIIPRKQPAYLESSFTDSIVSSASQLSLLPINLASNAFPALTSPELLAVIKEGVPMEVFSEVAEFITLSGADLVSIYDREFRVSSINRPLSNELIAPGYYSHLTIETIVAYHLARGFNESTVDYVNLSLEAYKNVTQALMIKYALRYPAIVATNAPTGSMHRGEIITKDTLQLIIDDKLLKTGVETLDSIAGRWLVSKGLVPRTDEFEGAYHTYLDEEASRTETIAKANQMTAVAITIAKFIHSDDFVTVLQCELKDGDLAAYRETSLVELRNIVESYGATTLTPLHDILVHAVTKVLFGNYHALAFVNTMNRAMQNGSEGMSGREAAAAAFIDSLSLWSANQITTVR